MTFHGLRLTVLLSLCSFHGDLASAQPPTRLNLSSIFDNRLVQVLRQATASLGPKPSAYRNLTLILESLELQNAQFGDPCDRKAWASFMRPIYEALFTGNIALQKNRNDNFALAILREPKLMGRVCMSTAEVLECHGSGKCDCLTILPPELKGSFVCQFQGGAGEEDGTENTAQGGLFGFFKNIFGTTSGTSAIESLPGGSILLHLAAASLIMHLIQTIP